MATNTARAATTITIPETSGRCRWCRCTYDNPCDEGCGWANRQQTLCTACVPLEESLRTASGRQQLAQFLQEHGFVEPRAAKLKRPGACIRPSCYRQRKSRRHKLCAWHSETA